MNARRIELRVRDDLNQATSSQELAIAKLQKLYELLIRPEAADLAASKVDTLVFILDGALPNVPMSALYDGQQYLVEQFSVAIAILLVGLRADWQLGRVLDMGTRIRENRTT